MAWWWVAAAIAAAILVAVQSKSSKVEAKRRQPGVRRSKRHRLKELVSKQRVEIEALQKEVEAARSARGGGAVDELEAHVALLKGQLKKAGVEAIDEVVSYDEAKTRLREATKRLLDGGDLEDEQAATKWSEFVSSHPQHAAEQRAEEAAWRTANDAPNAAALAVIRGFVPPDIFSNASLEGLVRSGLDPVAAKRVFATPALWLTRLPPERVARIHAADLRVRYAFSSLSLLELRALYASMPPAFEADDQGIKKAWFQSLEVKLKGAVKANPSGDKAAPACYGQGGRWALTATDPKPHADILRLLPRSPDDCGGPNAHYVPPALPKLVPPVSKLKPARNNALRSGLLASIENRPERQDDPRAGLLASIKNRPARQDDPRVGLLAAIQKRRMQDGGSATKTPTRPLKTPFKENNTGSPSPRTKLATILKSAP